LRHFVRVDRRGTGQGVGIPPQLASLDRGGATPRNQYRRLRPLPGPGRPAADRRAWRARLGAGDRADAGGPAPALSHGGATARASSEQHRLTEHKAIMQTTDMKSGLPPVILTLNVEPFRVFED